MSTTLILFVAVNHILIVLITTQKFFLLHTVLRKDQVEAAGGIFLCIKEGLDLYEEPELDVNAEIIWAKVTPSRRAPIYVNGGSKMGHLGQIPPLPLQEVAYKIEIL